MTGLSTRLREMVRRWRRPATPSVDLNDPDVRLDFADPGWRVRHGDRRRSVVGWATAAEPIEPDGEVYLVEPIVRNVDGILETVHGPVDLDHHTEASRSAGQQDGEQTTSRPPAPGTPPLDEVSQREVHKLRFGLTDEQVDRMSDLGLI